jgi:hypothetical protein
MPLQLMHSVLHACFEVLSMHRRGSLPTKDHSLFVLFVSFDMNCRSSPRPAVQPSISTPSGVHSPDSLLPALPAADTS